MNTPVALVEIDPPAYVLEVYRPFHDRLELAIKQADAARYDINTRGGMNLALQMRALFRGIRIDGEKQRKKFKAPFLETGKLLDSKYAEFEAKVAQYEISFDEDIKAKEKEIELAKAAEQERKDHIQALIDGIKVAPLACMTMTSEQTQVAIDELLSATPHGDVFAERADEAALVLKTTLEQLGAMLAGKQAQEEIARLQEASRLETERISREEDDAKAIADAEARKLQEVEAERIHIAGIELKRQQDELAAKLEQFNAEQDAALAAKIAKEHVEAEAILAVERAKTDAQARIDAEEKTKLSVCGISLNETEHQGSAQHVTQYDQIEESRKRAQLQQSAELQGLKQKAAQPKARPRDHEIIMMIADGFDVSEGTACDYILAVAESMNRAA